MRTVAHDSHQTMQRVKVGMTGLALVLLLIGLASIVFNSATRERPVEVAGAAQPDVVANLSLTNDNDDEKPSSGEPLAELGAAPSTSDANSASAAPVPPAAPTQKGVTPPGT